MEGNFMAFTIIMAASLHLCAYILSHISSHWVLTDGGGGCGEREGILSLLAIYLLKSRNVEGGFDPRHRD
jgi:hypothetical protein